MSFFIHKKRKFFRLIISIMAQYIECNIYKLHLAFFYITAQEESIFHDGLDLIPRHIENAVLYNILMFNRLH